MQPNKQRKSVLLLFKIWIAYKKVFSHDTLIFSDTWIKSKEPNIELYIIISNVTQIVAINLDHMWVYM